MARKDRKAAHVTRVEENRNTTTGQTTNTRFTPLEQDGIDLLVEKVQSAIHNKKISRSKVLRSLCYLHEDKMLVNKLVKSIRENL